MESYSPVLSPIEPYVRTPLRDTTNQYLSSSSKKSESGDSPICQRTFTKESEAEENLTSSQNSTPKKTQEGDPESDTTAEYESAGEASPWGKEPNLSALADCLAGVHLSTPDKKIHTKLNHFPFSPITAEDESDEEVTAIISHKAHNTNTGSLSLMEQEDSAQKNSSFDDGKNTPFVVISPSQVVANSTLQKKFDRSGQNDSLSVKSDSFRVIPELLAGDFTQSSSPGVKMESTSVLKIGEKDKPHPISPSVEFQDAGPACSFHSEIMNNLESQLLPGTPNSSLMSNNSLIIEECRHADTTQTSVSNLVHDTNIHENKVIDKIKEKKCNLSNNKSFSNITYHEEINVSKKKIAEREQNKSYENEFSELKETLVISQNASGSLKDIVAAEGKPGNLVEHNLKDDRNYGPLSNKLQIESVESVATFVDTEGFMSSNNIQTFSDTESSANRSHNRAEMDINKRVSLKDLVVAEGQPDHLVEHNLKNDRSYQQLSNSEQIELAEGIDSFVVSESVTSPNDIQTVSDKENSENSSNDGLEMDLNKSVSLKDILFDKPCSAVNVSVSSVVNLSIETKPEAALCNMTTEATDFQIAQNGSETTISKTEVIKSDCAFNENSFRGSESSLNNTSEKFPVSQEESSVMSLMPERNIYNTLDKSKSDGSIKETRTGEKILEAEHLESTNVFVRNSANINEDVCKLADKSHSISLEKGLDLTEESVTSEKLSGINISKFKQANESETKDQTNKNIEQIDNKGAFSQSSTNLSNSVHKFGNEKHPICLEEPSEGLNSTSTDKMASQEINLPSLETVALSENDIPLMEIEKKDKNSGNISISEMCNLIETTFNNSLKGNLDEICENIASTNLKPILLGKEVSVEGDSCESIFASSPVETVDFPPEPESGNISTALKSQCEKITDTIEKRDDHTSLQLTNNSLPFGQPSAFDGNCESSSKTIDSAPTINECTTSSEVVNSKTLNSILVLPSKTDQKVISLSNDNCSLLNTSVNKIATESVNLKTTETHKTIKMVNVEVIPCFPLAVSSESKLLKSPVLSLHGRIKENGNEIQESEITKLDNGILGEVRSLNIDIESTPSDGTVANCITTHSTLDLDTSCKLTPEVGKEIQFAEIIRTEKQNALESLNICSEFAESGNSLTNESKEVENIKTINVSKTFNNVSDQHDINSSLSVKKDLCGIDNSNNISVKCLKETLESQDTMETNVSPMLKANILPVSLSFTTVPSTPLTKSNDNKDCTGISSEPSLDLDKVKTESENYNPVGFSSNNSELHSLSKIKKIESKSTTSNELTNQLINIEEKIPESSSLLTSTDGNKNALISILSSNSQVTPPGLLGICATKENGVPHVVDKIDASTRTVIDNESIYSESMKNEPSLNEPSPDDSRKSTLKSGDHQFQTNASDNTSISLQSDLLKSKEFSEMVEGVANMKVESREKLCVSEDVIELKQSSQELSSIKTSSSSSPISNKTNVSKPLANEERSDIEVLSESKLKDNGGQTSISEGFTLKNTSTNSTERALVGSKEVLSATEQNMTGLNHIDSVSSQPQLIKGDKTTENEKCLPQDLIKSHFNKNVKESKHNVHHHVNREFEFNKLTIERKSYDDLLDKCFEQERLLDFDESIKEEADKIVKDLENFGQATSFTEPKSCNLTSPKVNSSEAGPTTAGEDIEKGDIFQDATTFDFEYLSKIRGKPGEHRKIRESLFLKFDPLASTTSPVPIPETQPQMEQNNKPQPDSSSDVLVTPPRATLDSKDEPLVNITPLPVDSSSPAARRTPQVKLRKSTGSVTPSLRHEFLSKEIYKLQELLHTQEYAYQEQIAACVDEIDELKQKLAELENQVTPQELEEKLLQAQSEIKTLKEKVEKQEEQRINYVNIILEYDKTATIIAEKNKKLQAEVAELRLEKEQDKQHLRNMEIAFNDIHQKYEKSKEAIALFLQNEAHFKFSLAENKKTIEQGEEKYQKMLAHASQKLEEANKEIIEMKKAHKAEIAKFEAINKKMEIQVKSVEENLEQKKIEVAELTKICDELICKFSQK